MSFQELLAGDNGEVSRNKLNDNFNDAALADDVPGEKNSIELDDGDHQLVGDAATPGNRKVYGTDAAGVKGWQDDPIERSKNSIEVDDGELQLVGDEATPASGRFYGTDGDGNKGWQGLPGGGQVNTVVGGDGISVDSSTASAPEVSIDVKNSVEVDAGEVQLVGDAATPGNNKYYGTDGAGVKGFHDTPDVPDAIDESERSVDPADDEGKVVKLEEDGRLSTAFMPGRPLAVYDLTESGTWTKPDFGSWAVLLVWGAGGGGGGYRRNTLAIRAHGGAGGAIANLIVPVPLLPDSVAYVIGEGGAGGNSTSNNDVQDGQNGGATNFGDFIEVAGGNGGKANPDNNTFQTGNDSNTVGLGFSLLQLLAGGRSGELQTSFQNTAQDAPDTTYQGAGAGGGQRNGTNLNVSVGQGGKNLFLGFVGGDGDAKATTSATGEAGETTCGGGGAITETGSSATGGKGGDGFIRIYII
jgi:hypothetical protein